jgi:hypothetical protein
MTTIFPEWWFLRKKKNGKRNVIFLMYGSGNLPLLVTTITAVIELVKCHHTSAK